MAFPNQVNLEAPSAVAESGTGTPWVDLADMYDGDLDTFGRSLSMSTDEEMKSVTLKGFDFSWFDNSLYDVTGVTLAIKFWSGASVEIYEAYLVDENGDDFGSNMAAGGLSNFFGVPRFSTIEQVVDVPFTAYSSANFGVRLKVRNPGVSVTVGIKINHVEMILQFARKRTTSEYGLKIRDAAGNDLLSPGGAFVRHIDVQHFLGGDIGTFPMPGFNDSKGVFFLVGHWEKFRIDNDTQQSRDYAWSNAFLVLRGHGMERPNIDWDPLTESFTLTNGPIYPLPNGWDLRGNPAPGFSIVGIHYK